MSAKEVEELVKGERSVPLIVDFYATWCGPCILMAQELETVFNSSYFIGFWFFYSLGWVVIPSIFSHSFSLYPFFYTPMFLLMLMVKLHNHTREC